MKTLIFETDPGGHRLQYVSLIADALLGLGLQVQIATSTGATETAAWREYVDSLSGRVQVSIVGSPEPGSSSRRARPAARLLYDAVVGFAPDHVYVPYGDGLTQWVSLHPGVRHRLHKTGATFEALVLRARFAYPVASLREAALTAASYVAARRSPWDVTHYLDPLAVEKAPRQAGQSSGVSAMPEPVEQVDAVSREEARAVLGLPVDGRYVVLPGSINGRKGADLLMQAFTEAGLGRDTRLLLAGPMAESVRSLLARRYGASLDRGVILTVDRFLSTSEFWMAIWAADIVAAPYPRHVGSSGVLARAAYATRPVIASNYGWVGEATRRYRLGLAVDVTDPAVFASSLESILGSPERYRIASAASEFVEFNTPEMFQSRWTESIRRRLG